MTMASLLANPFYITPNQSDIIGKSYSKTQTAFDSNTCTVEGDNITNSLNCANISPQTLGEKNSINIDNSQESTITQSSNGPQPPTPPSDQDLIHVVWEDRTPGIAEILYRKGDMNQFSPSIDLSNNERESRGPKITTSGNNVYVAWFDDIEGNNEILYRRSTDGGANFGSTINLSNNNEESVRPAIAASGNNVYVVWIDGQPFGFGNNEVFYRRSIDGGATFGPTINLSNNEGNSLGVSIAADKNNVYVAWGDTMEGVSEILYRRSTDIGVTFGPTINLSNNDGFSNGPVIAVYEKNVHITWSDTTLGNIEIFYRKSSDSGTIFGGITNLSNTDGESSSPTIDVQGENVYVAWSDGTLGSNDKFHILYIKSTDGGVTFSSTINLSENLESSFGPDLESSQNNVYIVWSSGGTSEMPFEIIYRKSADGGNMFSNIINLSDNAGDSTSSSIAISNKYHGV